MVYRSRIKHSDVNKFIDILKRTGNVSEAARMSGVSRRSFYYLRAKDSEFAERWEHAIDEAMDDLESCLRTRAMDGVDKPVFYAGKQCGTQKVFSDSLGAYLLKRQDERRAQHNPHGGCEEEDSAREALAGKIAALVQQEATDER